MTTYFYAPPHLLEYYEWRSDTNCVLRIRRNSGNEWSHRMKKHRHRCWVFRSVQNGKEALFFSLNSASVMEKEMHKTTKTILNLQSPFIYSSFKHASDCDVICERRQSRGITYRHWNLFSSRCIPVGTNIFLARSLTLSDAEHKLYAFHFCHHILSVQKLTMTYSMNIGVQSPLHNSHTIRCTRFVINFFLRLLSTSSTIRPFPPSASPFLFCGSHIKLTLSNVLCVRKYQKEK